jgi:hypothetical protein
MRTFPKTRAAARYAARHARAELARPGPVKGGEQAGLAVVITHFGAERGLGPCHDVGGERLGGRGGPPQPVAGGLVAAGAQRAVDGRRGREVSHPELLEHLPGQRGRKPGVQQDAARPASRRHKKAPSRLTCSTRCHSASDMSVNGWLPAVPASATRQSRWPNRSSGPA